MVILLVSNLMLCLKHTKRVNFMFYILHCSLPLSKLLNEKLKKYF
nr:MAG TPA: hypothetical protein [Bacteriophage sp.]